MWVYRNPTNHLILFDYRKGRGKSGPMERLGSFEGTIQCDGYAVYKSIAQSSQGIRLMSCMAHIRRKFFDAMEHHPKAAEYAIGEISGWYALERKYRENKYTPEERLLHRRKVSVRLSAYFLLKKVFLALRQKDETSLYRKSEAKVCPGL
jgi:hypothetical protein